MLKTELCKCVTWCNHWSKREHSIRASNFGLTGCRWSKHLEFRKYWNFSFKFIRMITISYKSIKYLYSILYRLTICSKSSTLGDMLKFNRFCNHIPSYNWEHLPKRLIEISNRFRCVSITIIWWLNFMIPNTSTCSSCFKFQNNRQSDILSRDAPLFGIT